MGFVAWILLLLIWYLALDLLFAFDLFKMDASLSASIFYYS